MLPKNINVYPLRSPNLTFLLIIYSVMQPHRKVALTRY